MRVLFSPLPLLCMLLLMSTTAHAQTCSSDWNINNPTQVQQLLALQCTAVGGSVSITLPVGTVFAVTYNFTTITSIGKSLSVTFSDSTSQNTQVIFPVLSVISTSLSVTATAGLNNKLHLTSLTSVQDVTVSVSNSAILAELVLNDGLSSNNNLTMKALSISSGYGNSYVASVRINRVKSMGAITINPIQAEVTSVVISGIDLTTGAISIQYSYPNSIYKLNSLAITGLRSVTSFSVATLGAPINSVSLSGTNWTMSGLTQISVTGWSNTVSIGTIAFNGVQSMQGLGLGFVSAMNTVAINGSSLTMGDVTFSTLGNAYVMLSNLIITGLSSMTSFKITPNVGGLSNVLLAATSGSTFTIGADLSLVGGSSGSGGAISNVTIRGLSYVGGSVTIKAQVAAVSNITINDEITSCAASSLVVEKDLTISTGTAANVVGVTFYGLTRVKGSTYVRTYVGSIKNVAFFPALSGNCSPLTLAAVVIEAGLQGYSTPAPIDNLSLTNLGSVSSITVRSVAAPITGTLWIGGNTTTGLSVSGTFAVTASPTNGNPCSIGVVNITSVARINQLTLTADGTFSSTGIFATSVSGLPSGGNITQPVTISNSKTPTNSNTVNMTRVEFTNMRSVGGLTVTTAVTISKITMNGTNDNPLILGPVSFRNLASTNPEFILGAVSNITGTLNLVSGGTGSTRNSIYINAPVGSGPAPLLTITGDVTIGSTESTYSLGGPVVIDQLARANGNFQVNFANSVTTGAVTVRGPPTYLTIGGKLIFYIGGSSSTSVSISNLATISGTTVTGGRVYADAYRGSSTSSSSYTGTITINNRAISNSLIDTTQYTLSNSAWPNDVLCINTCTGRGMSPLGASSCTGNCTCFPGWQGPTCTSVDPCGANPTCSCLCGSWSEWTNVQAGQTAATRTRTCIAHPSTTCASLELQGTIQCSASEYESAPSSFTSFRICSPIRVCDTSYEYESAAPTATTNRACLSLRNCTGLEFQSAAPTATTNRGCTTLRVCNNTYEYQTAPLTGTTDRDCALIRNCTSLEYQTVAPTATSNRNCADLRVCDALTEYQTVAPNATTNRDCQLLLTCAMDTEYQKAAPTATSNRQCSKLTAPCDTTIQYEMIAATPTSDRTCRFITLCSVLEYEKSAPTPSSDRLCLPYTVCTSAEYQSVAPTLTTDRTCTATTICTAGQKVWQQATTTSDRICSTDFCASTPCLNGATCYNDRTAPTCLCTAGYEGNLCQSKIVYPCDSKPCANSGTCYNVGNTFACICATGYTGATCQDQSTASNPCNSGTITCQNGGTCYSPSAGNAACLCKTGFSGTYCQTVVKTVCDSNPNPCKNSGKCVLTTANAKGYICNCTADYTGATCTDLKNICKSLPCKNNGTCATVNEGGDFSCKCPGGWYGKDCSLSKCKPNPCLNGGTCATNSSTSFTCTCPGEFGDSICSSMVCTPSFCRNGGVCSGTNITRTCACSAGFTGIFCDDIVQLATDAPEASSSSSSTGPIAGAVSGVGVLAVIIIIAVVVRRRRDRQPRVASMPEANRFICFENEEALKSSTIYQALGHGEYETSTYDLASGQAGGKHTSLPVLESGTDDEFIVQPAAKAVAKTPAAKTNKVKPAAAPVEEEGSEYYDLGNAPLSPPEVRYNPLFEGQESDIGEDADVDGTNDDGGFHDLESGAPVSDDAKGYLDIAVTD